MNYFILCPLVLWMGEERNFSGNIPWDKAGSVFVVRNLLQNNGASVSLGFLLAVGGVYVFIGLQKLNSLCQLFEVKYIPQMNKFSQKANRAGNIFCMKIFPKKFLSEEK
ncbi:hypothetical protein AVEN_45726-1 [Araneus ventricosus]|uniref:Uncharacterized protein n=1 Tax=Araneus ventricosus TaxID=182803 RepID=A0A4Y2KAZ0_ARAVE|nr:hypothetical protein AVEN_45726-1 [Araneus ventricosus]